MKTTIHILGIACLVCMLYAFDLPKGWFPAGSSPKSYEMGLDERAGRDGGSCATIQSIYKTINGFGTLMQSASPKTYLGKRVRMTGYIKTENAAGWVGMWLRVDKGTKVIGFDNMGTRPIKGTTEWKQYAIVLDIANDAELLSYGVLMEGTGKVWFDDIQFQTVDASVPTTGEQIPSNLNFEEK